MMTFGSLFAGIGGFDLGLERAGMICKWQVENNPFCTKVLEKHWPDVKRYGDIRNVEKLEAVDLICGGFPCQPFSCAGQRRGKDDDRFLWPETIRVIRLVKPNWIVLENVNGLTTMAEQYSDVEVESKTVVRFAESDFYKGIFSRQEILLLSKIITDIEEAGYELPKLKDGTPVIPVIPACALNAPHRRDRAWIIASHQAWNERSLQTKGSDRNASDSPNSRVEDVRRERENAVLQDTDASDTCNQGLQGSKLGNALHGNGNGQKTHGSTPKRNNAWDEPWIEAATRLCRVDDGVSNRVHRLRSLGNAVVPQIVEVIGRAIMEVEHGNR